MTKLSELLAINLDRLVDEAGSKRKFSELTGVSRSILDKYLDQEASPTVDTLERIAEAFKETVHDLLIDPKDKLSIKIRELEKSADQLNIELADLKIQYATDYHRTEQEAKKSPNNFDINLEIGLSRLEGEIQEKEIKLNAINEQIYRLSRGY
jgi:transcriptional regulator with XRE-family HTH domain